MYRNEDLPLPSGEALRIIEAVDKKTKTKAYRFTIGESRRPGLTDTKFGGLPYFKNAAEYPVNSRGQKLMLLAQIRLDRIKNDPRLPSKGLLQFYVLPDEYFGMGVDRLNDNENYRVVYIEDIDESVTEADVRAMGIPASCDKETDIEFPIFGEYAVDMETAEMCADANDFRYEELFFETAAGMGLEFEEDACVLDVFDEDTYNSICCRTEGHHLFGWPMFTQSDPRCVEGLSKYDTLLFQMDTDCGPEDERGSMYRIMWGDVGVANFFIASEKLAKHDFSDIMYSWDCC